MLLRKLSDLMTIRRCIGQKRTDNLLLRLPSFFALIFALVIRTVRLTARLRVASVFYLN